MKSSQKRNISDDDSDADSGTSVFDAKRSKISSTLLASVVGGPSDVRTEQQERMHLLLTLFKVEYGKDFIIACQGWKWYLHTHALRVSCTNVVAVVQEELFPTAGGLHDDAIPTFDPNTKLPMLVVIDLAPVVVDMVVDYWYTRRTDIRKSAQIDFGKHIGHHTLLRGEQAGNHSNIPTKFQQYYGMATLAQKFGDERLYNIAMTKFRVHLRSLCEAEELLDTIKTFYQESYDNRHDIQVFRDVIAHIAFQRELHFVGHSMTIELHEWVVSGNNRFIEDLDRVSKADDAGNRNKGHIDAVVKVRVD